jgi:cobalt/nickel transport system ATP-binding protein
MRPEVLVLDEPTAGLDFHGVMQLLSVPCGNCTRAGATLVFSTHDVELAYGWADEVAVFHEGTVRIQGETTAVLGHRELIASLTRLHPPLLLEVAQALGVNWSAAPPRARDDVLSLLRKRLGAQVISSERATEQGAPATAPIEGGT